MYHSTTGIGPVDPTAAGKTGVKEFHSEALIKPPFVRERPPLAPLQKRTPMSIYAPSDAYVKPSSENCSTQNSSAVRPADRPSKTGLVDTKITGGRPRVNTHSSHNISMLHAPHHSQLSHGYSQNSLHRSVSQLISMQDKKSLMEDGPWDPGVQGRDSGMLADDEEFVDAIKGFSAVRNEHTMFTDTHL
ncbi:hypothetical protein AAFF_G00396980 [Aldrovandia affinis]|uniref:Uncharacterized protein n=1 Tax=Aldrovandia affinis TaxID=143900 RepID=A0AAD7SD02_9TELE|nr:hypothetical protein AAFF_G00396980 [Aldrovandia affinis]